jgi:hypothetical protein
VKIGGLLLTAALTLTIPIGISSPATAAPATATKPAAAPPDPTARGPYGHQVIQEAKFGLATIQEPNSDGAAPTAGTSQAAERVEIRGQLYMPDWSKRTKPSPLIVLVHGNHGSCDSGQNSAGLTCAQFKHNESGYAYLAENLATWGYTTFSLSQDQLMMRQDGNKGKGMHNRRMLIAATLDAITAAAGKAGLPADEHTTVGTALAGRLDLSRIGMMGHSRGGDAVTNFIDYNRIRTDGPRYPISGVISLAPTDYERKAPYGMPYMTILPMCDGDVSNLMGARQFERGQTINADDPYPRIQVEHLGAIHNWYNTVWYADGGADGQSNNDAACGNSAPFATNNIHPNNLRLSGAASSTDAGLNYRIDNSDPLNPEVNTKISGDPERMGDQEKLGLATMAAFFRRYIGGEGAFEPYMTGELANTADHLQVPPSACPTSESGTRIPCAERVNTSYYAGAGARVDLITPGTENPLSRNDLGGSLTGEGFADPYAQAGGTTPKPPATPGGYDWCNPEPQDFAPGQLGKTGLPAAAKQCPLPAPTALGGQNGTRENAPVNHSYGPQLTLAWEAGAAATLTAEIPADARDMSGLEALALGAAVNFFDTRNPGADNRGDNTRDTTVNGTPASPVWPNEKPTSYDPTSTSQNFVIALRDTDGAEATVQAGDPRWGNALHMTTGTNTPNTHIVLDQIRVPLSEFASQGVDVSSLASLEFRFGAESMPASGSIQMSDVRFQETVSGKQIQSDGVTKANGAGYGRFDHPVKAAGEATGNVWTVDDDRAQCPNAQFTSIQTAVEAAAPWDTINVCDGVYQEQSTPLNHNANPVQSGARNGLTITKPLTIRGTGADRVTIEPVQTLGDLAGTEPYLRDGGGNVITVSRQSLGSTDTNEMFVDISGVTVTSGDVWAEAGIAYFGAAGRVTDSVVGPLKTASDEAGLAAHPHGWGIIKTGIIQGTGTGTVESELSVSGTLVRGFQSGGILFDGARGKDGAADNTVRTGIRYHGYVTDSVIAGTGTSTGIAYTSGVDGHVGASRITGGSRGLLLSDAGAVTVAGNVLTGSSAYAVLNTGAPATVAKNYIRGPVSGVTVLKPLSSAPRSVPTRAGEVTDKRPSATIASPGRKTSITAGEGLDVLVRASDDYGVKSVSLYADGIKVGTSRVSPYRFTFTPSSSLSTARHGVSLTAVAVDSSGSIRISDGVSVTVVPAPTLKVSASAGEVKATVNSAGTVTVRGDKVVTVSRKSGKAGTVALPLTLTAAYQDLLNRHGKVDVIVTVTFENAAGEVSSQPIKVTISRKR